MADSEQGPVNFVPADERSAAPSTRLKADSDSTLAHNKEARRQKTRSFYDFNGILKDIVKKREDAGIHTRELGVLFQDLRVVGLGATAGIQPTLGAMFNPKVIAENIRAGKRPALRDILSGFEGTVRPGEMLLVLGRPGSGCSTFLKTLANQRAEYHAVEGTVAYDAVSPSDVSRHFRGDVLYVPEDDIHFPTLSVGNTLNFAARVRAPQSRVTGQTRNDYVEKITNMYATVFGLNHVKGTVVGNAAIRGVSGGEKKRVSLSEAFASRSIVTSWDNSTRGLDSSTALEFVHALRTATNVERLTTIVSLYQAGEQLYDLFDKVCLIYEGRLAYYGPARQAKQYFLDLGYEPANRQTTADFLVAVTDPLGRIPRNPAPPHPVPRTAAEFAARFSESALGRDNREDVSAFRNERLTSTEKSERFREGARLEHAKHARTVSPFLLSVPMQVRAVMKRRVQIIRGNPTSYFIQAFSFGVNAIILGTTFLKAPKTTGAFFSRGGVIFFSTFLPALVNLTEVPALFAQRPMVSRHKKAAMYHPFIEAAAMTIVDIPITFTIILIFCVVLYFLVQLQQTASQFFIFFLFVFTTTITMKAFFRALAAIFVDEAPAQAIAGIILLGTSLYTGYLIPVVDMIGALHWISYINPLRYTFEAVLVNELHTLNAVCSNLVPSGPGYDGISLQNQVCPTVGGIPGQNTVNGSRFTLLSYSYRYSHVWRNYGILVAFLVFFVSALLLFTEINTKVAGETATILFKRGARSDALRDAQAEAQVDEEKAGPSSSNNHAERPDTAVGAEAAEKERSSAEGALDKMNHTFSWQHMSYVVPVDHGKTRQLLDDVSGYVAPGRLTALMGESGAGKTTLLNVLAQRVGRLGVVGGDRYVNGQGLPHDFQAQTGYCQQMDTHVGTTTVREALVFSAKLRQPASVPDSEKEAYAEQCLKMCGLVDYADAMVGSLGVEHRKRTTIAVELAAKPQLLLFLDEPTSGLDSQSAWAIVSFLRSLADHGQAILCTIHQPSAELFQVFDRLLLLRKGGQTVYFGDIGRKATTVIKYFERNGSRPVRDGENPAEFMLDVIGAGATATASEDWHQIWVNSSEAGDLQGELERIHSEGRERPAIEATFQSEFATRWPYQLKELLKRNLRSYWRDPPYLMAKLTLNIIGGLFIGFTFFHSGTSLQANQNKLFAMFMGVILCAPLGQQIVVPIIKLRDIYEIREQPSRMYSWSALLTAQMLTELPWNLLGSSLFFLCWFWTVGFESSRAGYTYLLFGVLFPFFYTTLSAMAAALASTPEIGGLVYSLFFSFIITFNGVTQPYRSLNWWRWMYRLSPFTYLIEGLIGQGLGGQRIECAPKEYGIVQPPSGQSCSAFFAAYIQRRGGYLSNPDAMSDCSFCSARTTDEYFQPTFNIFRNHHWRNAGFLCAYILFNIGAAYVLTYTFRVRSGNPIHFIKGLLARRRRVAAV